jgi:carbonic anhydrase
VRRRLFVLLIALSGCKYLDAPKKVAELEKRLDEVSTVLTDMTGEPVGQRPGSKKAEGEDDEEEDGGKGKKSAKDKKAKGGKDSKDSKVAKGGKEARDSKAGRSRRGADDSDADEASDDGKDKDRDKDKDKDASDDEADADRPGADDEAEPEPPAAAAKPPANVHWSYEGEEGPTSWGKLDPSFELCAKGEHQSPVDIMPRRSKAPDVIMVYHPTAGAVVDNGHTVEVDLDPGSFIVVDGTRFDLIQFHVHTPSEHTVAGDRFPLELHLVHRSKAGALAVVAVLYTEGAPSPTLASVWKDLPRAKGSVKLKKPFDPSGLIPKDQAAYRYDGSLTTPPCTEGVIWYVLRRQATEDIARIDALKRRFGANARPVQELAGRELR